MILIFRVFSILTHKHLFTSFQVNIYIVLYENESNIDESDKKDKGTRVDAQTLSAKKIRKSYINQQ